MAGNRKGRKRRFGSVRQLPSGRWQVRYQGPDGLMRPADRTFPTQTDAEVWLTVVQADLVRGTWFDLDAGRVPLDDYAKRWVAERPGLSSRTITLYDGLVRLHISPALGRFDLVDLTPARIRAWRKELLDGGLGEVTVAKCYRLLRAVLNTAVDDELIRRNPCRIKGAGSETSPERPIATPAQVQALVAAMPERWQALVLLAVSSSLRWGELMALTRADVNLRTGTVRVTRSLSDDRGRMALGPPKSAAGKRMVAIPDPVVPVLREHLRGVLRRRPRWPGVRRGEGGDAAAVELPDDLAAWREGGWSARGLPVPRPAPHGEHLGGRQRGQPAGAHGADGAQQHAGGADLPACVTRVVIAGSRTGSAVNWRRATTTTRATRTSKAAAPGSQLGDDLARIWHEGRSGAQSADRTNPPRWALTWCGAGDEDRTRTVSLGS